ncbi:biotin-dependent carboxyltransferase family protein [Leifsonia sp. fls2-241-R2A-40a]|uniref:5-oxoprolinase subunit C family protein n=1 Tax=Leifsonia sp. fls2-241-R2A-40a TaxID=3040290 RepID=UPI002549DCE2|nr:biotin-dependent carboxyltransferase family protein [Leifsonia sp. fls2-241-R2A-40a]
MTTLHVLNPGPLSLVQDLGRPGFAAMGVGRSGALDRGALRLGNRLVGNDEGEAGIEVLLGGFEARFDGDAWFAVTGAVGGLTLDGRDVDAHQAVRARAGQVLGIGTATSGARWYLAVRGGVAVPAVLGSRSRDTLAGLGPAPLQAGDVVELGDHPGSDLPLLDFVPVLDPALAAVEVRAHRGPRADWFTPAALDAFFSVEWRAAAESDRIGVRLDAVRVPAHAAGSARHPVPLLERAVARELPSEPMVAGAVQVSPDGRPTVLLADHPVTGGYPVIAVVADASLDAFAQLRPGQSLTFRHA